MTLTPKMQQALQANLMKELGLEGLPVDQQERILMNTATIINQNIALRLLEELPEDKAKELEVLMTDYANEPEKLQVFFQQEMPNFDEMVTEEIASYKQDLLDKFSPTKAKK